MQLYMYCNGTLYNNKIHIKHKETEHVQNLHLIYSFAVLPETSYICTPTPPPLLPTTNHYKHISRNPELPFCSNIIHYSVLYNYTVYIVHA